MSQPSSANTPRAAVQTQKQKTNVYTVMLFLSFVAIVLACVLLWLELKQWGDYPWWKTNDAIPKAGGGAALLHTAPTLPLVA